MVTKDGVASKTDYQYNQASGASVRTLTSSYNIDGKIERHVAQSKLGFESYAMLADHHLLSVIVQSQKTVAIDTAAPTVTKTSVTTWKPFPESIQGDQLLVPGAHKRYKWLGGPGSADFDFQAYSGPTEPPSNWYKVSEVLSRTDSGLMLERSDPDGLITSHLYDKDQSLTVAAFSNAAISKQEAFYYGFEPYEQIQGWAVTKDTPVVMGNSHTGNHRWARCRLCWKIQID